MHRSLSVSDGITRKYYLIVTKIALWTSKQKNCYVSLFFSSGYKILLLFFNEVIYCAELQHFFSKPLWETIASLVSNVPLPTPGKERVFFSIENSLLAIEVPPKDGLPHADVCCRLLFLIICGPQQTLIVCTMIQWLSQFIFISWQISFQPLVQSLDVDNLIKLFTAVLLERRILLRSDK